MTRLESRPSALQAACHALDMPMLLQSLMLFSDNCVYPSWLTSSFQPLLKNSQHLMLKGVEVLPLILLSDFATDHFHLDND